MKNSKRIFSANEIRRFDRLTNAACSGNQMARIRARLDLTAWQEDTNEEKWNAMCEWVKRKDARKRKEAGL